MSGISGYSKNFVKLMCGAAGAQALNLLTLPILTRMYTVSDFGVQVLYMTIVSILAIVATGRYELAILLPKEDDESFSLVILVLMITIVSCLGIEIISLIGGWWIADILQNEELVSWLPFLPFTIFIQVNYNVWYAWLNRNRAYNVMSRLAIITTLFNFIPVFVYGVYTNAEAHGLLLNTFTGTLMCCLYMFYYCKRNNLYTANINIGKIKVVMHRYKSFPRDLIVAGILERGATQLPFWILNTIGGVYITGLYSMVYKIMQVPVSLVGSAMGNVFVQEASALWMKDKNCWAIYWRTIKILTLMGCVPFGILWFSGEFIIPFFLGEKWRDATGYITLLCPMFYMMLISSPLSQVIFVSEKTKMELLICTIKFILVFVSMLGMFFLAGTVDAAIWGLGVAFFIFYSWQIVLNAKWAKGESFF